VPHTLKDFGVNNTKFELMSAMAPEDPTAGGNPVPLDVKSAHALYEATYSGKL
jgi:alcohol dehydrogenase class IV